MNDIGKALKRIRGKKTQSEFAERIGISRSYLGDLENNRKNPSIETLSKIANKLDISLNELLYPSDTDRIKRVINEYTDIPNNDALEKTIAFFERNPMALQHNDEEIFEMYLYFQTAFPDPLEEKSMDALFDMTLSLVEGVTKRVMEIDDKTNVNRLQVSKSVMNQLINRLALANEEENNNE